MMKNRFCVVPSFALAMLASSAALAAPVIYFGENQTANLSVSGSPVAARAQFLSNLSGVSSQGFESFAVGTRPPISMTFAGSAGNLSATLTGVGRVDDRTNNGRFNTTTGGSKWYDVSGAFNITFGTAIAAFGFYGTDIGDFSGRITLSLTDTNDVVTSLTVPNTIDGTDGSLLFYGFIDSTKAYKAISFGNTSPNGTDVFGFDDMVIGERRQIGPPTGVPEPGSLALVGLSLAAVVAATRRKARK